MYILYYYNEALNISTIEVENLTQPIRCPENLFFIALRKGKTFIKEPAECIGFTDLERLFIRSFGISSFAFKNETQTNFRLQNSYLNAGCADGDDGAPKECGCGCDGHQEECNASLTFYGGLTERRDYSKIIGLTIGNYVGFCVEFRNSGGNWLSTDIVAANGNYNLDINGTGIVYGNLEIRLNKNRGECISNSVTYDYYELVPPPVWYVQNGTFACQNGQKVFIFSNTRLVYSNPDNWGIGQFVDSTPNSFAIKYESKLITLDENYIITKIETEGNAPCTRFVSEVQISAVKDEVVTLSYTIANGNLETQTWTAGGNGELVYYAFGIGKQVFEPTISVDAGQIFNIAFID